MPLVRVEVRNEYGLGMQELYTEINREDPKAVLDGVAVAGLVGILRQLGDLAEFAAEIFHGLQEQVLITSSRSHKLVERVHDIESALPPLEKAILAQRSHLHFAYTAGSHWHTRLRIEQNHFIYSDLPRCIMDSYEDCRDPPRLHKLDKFDIGGPGSCFRRYSDPTYFKRTSAGPYEAHLQSVPRSKKTRRNKKKRSSLRHKDVTHDAPIIMHAGRTDFNSTNFEEKASPSQNVSTFNVPQKPEIEPEVDHLTSFDSRNGSGYIDCIFRPSYSTQSEDNNASDSNLQHNSYLDENSGVSDENIQNSYLAENSKSRSPYITWDEKLEIIDSTGQPNEKIDNEDKEDMNSRDVDHIDHIDFDFHDEQTLPTSVIVKGQPDEIESETDYYLDALNTIESESETDLDYQTKRELKQYPNVEEMQKLGPLDDNSMNFEFHVPEPSCSISPENENYEGLTLTESDQATSPQEAGNGISSISVTTAEKFKSEEVEPNSQSLASQQILTTRSTSGDNTIVNNPVMFWTNGGLLGLEPSKPPDFGLPNMAGSGPVKESQSQTDKTQHSSQQNTINDMAVNAPKSESSGKGHDGNSSSTMTPGINGPVHKDDDHTDSSRILEFSNRLLVNGFRKQISLVGNERLASSVKSDVPDNTSINKRYQNVTGIPFREQFGNGISNVSPSSPPLEHMRISFQPIDGFETSRLKLMFPDGNNNNNNESNGHVFPSFQLVPEPSISLHDSGSDSDDDTFCRSSPYASDDCHSQSQPSESNSDHWDSSDSPRIKNHEVDDAFGRISSAESVSSSLVNGIKFHQSSITENGLLFDIPNFDSLNASDKEPTPPPPLPPMEWRGIKPHPSVTMEKEDGLSEALTFALTLTPQKPVVPQQPKPALTQQDQFVDTVDLMPKHKQPDWQNLHVQNESNSTTNGKVGDEKEDFLQQIRRKSLNLRRTSTTRPTITPAGPPGVKVTAILEKATAIRQAVGSDDGEDDNWSDT